MKIAIIVEGGVVQEVISNENIKIRVIDRDTDGVEPEDLIAVENNDAYIYNGVRSSNLQPERTEKIFSEISFQERHKA